MKLLRIVFAVLVIATASFAGSISTAQVTLGTSASVVLASYSGSRSVLIRNLDSSISIYVGTASVSSSTGMLVKAGESISFNSTAAVYAIAASGTPSISYLAEND